MWGVHPYSVLISPMHPMGKKERLHTVSGSQQRICQSNSLGASSIAFTHQLILTWKRSLTHKPQTSWKLSEWTLWSFNISFSNCYRMWLENVQLHIFIYNIPSCTLSSPKNWTNHNDYCDNFSKIPSVQQRHYHPQLFVFMQYISYQV